MSKRMSEASIDSRKIGFGLVYEIFNLFPLLPRCGLFAEFLL